MLFCYVSIINTVKRGNALSAEGDLSDRQRKIERDVTIVSLMMLHPGSGSGSVLIGQVILGVRDIENVYVGTSCGDDDDSGDEDDGADDVLGLKLLIGRLSAGFHSDLYGLHPGVVSVCCGVHVVGVRLSCAKPDQHLHPAVRQVSQFLQPAHLLRPQLQVP